MTSERKQPRVRPMRVFVGPGSPAEADFRAQVLMPEPAVIAPGVPPSPAHDLQFHGGHIIADLVYTNFYVGGAAAWQASDIQNIDQALAAAMADPNLNNVMVQYFHSGAISTTFKPSQVLAGPPPSVVSQGDVENLALSLLQMGTLKGYDFTATVFNFLLPSGTILNTDAAPTMVAVPAILEQGQGQQGQGQQADPHQVSRGVEQTSDSTQGLGGYHGSVHATTVGGSQTIYYAVGVYSEQLPNGVTNGIPVFAQPWKSVVATFYHELNEARTDPDVEDAIRAGNDPNAVKFLGWTSAQGEECGDYPVFEANPLSQVFQEVTLTDGSGTVPVQFQYSDAVHGPEGPTPTPDPYAG